MTTMLTMTISVWVMEDDTTFNPDIVSPGVAGFIMTAVLALAIIFLGMSLVRRLRRSAYREQIIDELEDEIADRDANTAGNTSASGTQPSSGGGTVVDDASDSDEGDGATDGVRS